MRGATSHCLPMKRREVKVDAILKDLESVFVTFNQTRIQKNQRSNNLVCKSKIAIYNLACFC